MPGDVRSVSVAELVHAPIGPGTVLQDVADSHMNPEGFLEIIRGVAPALAGRHIANMTSVPSIAESDEIQDITESLVGLKVDLKGATRIVKITNEMSVELASLSERNLKVIRPDYVATDILAGAAAAALTVGAGNAAVSYAAKQKGTGGNGIRIAYVNPGVANTPLSVAVAPNTRDITVTLANGATAGTITSTAAQVRDAVNASLAASALVAAALPATSDGTGLAAAFAMTALSGGTDVKIGRRLRRTGQRQRSHYSKNFVFLCPTISNTVGYAWVLENCINVNDDAEYEPDENGEIFGVEVTMRAHADGGGQDMETGQFGVPAYMMVFDPAAEV